MNNKPFESIDEVDDVRILIKAKGKHYSVVPNNVMTSEEAKEVRIGILRLLLEFHEIVDTPLEDLKENIQQLIK